MARRRIHREVGILILSMLVVMLMMQCESDLTKDKEECANQLAGLATCLPYVGGEAKSPTLDCCTGLKQVLKDSKKCLCILVKDSDDPTLGLKINSTLALGLPHTCHAPSTVSECPALLHLAPNSPDAKVFTDFAKASAPTSSTTSPASTGKSSGSSTTNNAKIASDGGEGNRWQLAQIFHGVLLIWCFISHFIF